MPQYVLVDRPVILSKNKRNVILHGRPLSPIGSLRSISPYVPRQNVKGPFVEEKHGDTLSVKSSHSVPPASLTEYQKSAQENLISINNNLSNMLQETFSGIDSICQKVRLCLLEADTVKVAETSDHSVPMEIGPTLDTREEVSSNVPYDDAVSSIQLAEIVEENVSFITENEAGKMENTEKQKKIPSLTPFFTVLDPDTQSAESVGAKFIKSITCTAENFQKTMKEVEKYSNYETFLASLVDDVRKEIDECYQKIGKDNKTDGVDQNIRPKSSPMERRRRTSTDRFNSSKITRETKRSDPDLSEDHLFESDLLSKDSAYRVYKRDSRSAPIGKTDFSSADVYRKRAITDLHKRMVVQVEANDSLIFFQKLMRKNRKYLEMNNRPQSAGQGAVDQRVERNSLRSPMDCLLPQKNQERNRQQSLGDISNKYRDSLWFRQNRHEMKRAKRNHKGKKTAINNGNLQNCTVQKTERPRGKPSRKKSTMKATVENEAPACQCKVSVANNQSLSDSEKCRIHWMRAKYAQLNRKRLKYLDILDDITAKDLLPLKAEYPRRDGVVKTTDIKDSYLYKLLYGKGPGNRKAWAELFEPSIKCSKENCEKCNVSKVMEKKEGQNDNYNVTKDIDCTPTSDPDKDKIAKTLSKYIFPEKPCSAMIPKNVFTVMPVHVFYDNSRVAGANRRPEAIPQKLPLVPMKETKDGVKKAEWTLDGHKKPKPMKIVYDPILRKIEKEIRMVSAKHDGRSGPSKLAAPNSWTPKNFNQYCSPHRQVFGLRGSSMKTDIVDKPNQQPRPLIAINCRTPPVAEIYKRSPKAHLSKLPHQVAAPLLDSANCELTACQQDSDASRTIQKEIEAQALRSKNDQDRKIWENKYGKSVGQKLLNFIEKQPSVYEVPPPKHTLPKPAKDATRQHHMLEHLRTLKQKKDNIQTFQKTIEVIETKMVDILCKPATTQSIEAFDEMEKEITSLLSEMKAPTLQRGTGKTIKQPTVHEYDSDVNKISDELFRKLDKILESPDMTGSAKSSKGDLIRGQKSKRKIIETPPRTPAKSSDMNQVCFSSTSASGEEKFIITAISPKRNSKTPLVPPFIKTSNLNEPTDEPIRDVGSELRKWRNDLRQEQNGQEFTGTGEVKGMKMDALRNVGSNVMPGKGKIIPVQQVVNLALINTNKECPGGDQPCESSNFLHCTLAPMDDDNADEPSCSIGDGDNYDEKLSQTQSDVCIKISPKAKRKSERIEEIAVKYQEAVVVTEQPLEITETSGPYFTPQTSPLTGTRDPEPRINPTTEENENLEVKRADVSDELKSISTPEDTRTSYSRNEGLKEGDNSSDEMEITPPTDLDDESSEKSIERDYFYQNVNKIIARVESVYNQLEDFEEEMRSEDSPTKIAIFQEPPKAPELESDDFLTPFMHAVRDLRTAACEEPETRPASAKMHTSPSYFNVLSFLNTLTDFKEERALEVHTSRVLNFAYVCYTPLSFHQLIIENQSVCNTPGPAELPKKKSGCLKDPSSILNMTSAVSKSRQKVSFLLQKEEKATQAAPCPLHATGTNMHDQKISSDASTYSTTKDEQVSAYLDASENKSVDKMSWMYDEDNLSTLELSDEMSSNQNQMQEKQLQSDEEIIQNDQHITENRKNVVEIFRNSSSEERGREKVKVFYDNYKKGGENLDSQLISGFYNESSILQVKQSLSKDLAVKKRDSLERLAKNLDPETFLKQFLQETSLFEPLKKLSYFIDSKLLKEAIEQRQKIRMMRQKSATKLISERKKDMCGGNTNEKRDEGENENFLKGVYVFVYLLMFTALNLEYKCVQ